jgi:hypothetical protein
MWLSSLVQSLNLGGSVFARRSDRSFKIHVRRRRSIPRLEALEDRTLLSTFTVSNTADSGAGSLRAAIAGAASGDTIVFSNRLAAQTITLTSGELAITKNLSISGLGANRLTISGNDAQRVFDVAAGATVSISNLTIADGFADQGAGIQNAGTLLLSKDVFTHNEAVGDTAITGVGGGIFNETGASLTVTSCKFTNNEVIGGAGIGFGGGLFNIGAATVSDSTFTSNSAIGGANGYGAGGAINCQNNGTLTVAHSTFTNNTADEGQSPFLEASGAAIDSEVGTTLAVSDSTFKGNLVTAKPTDPTLAPFAFAAGGAILSFQGTMSITGSAFIGNEVSSTGVAFSGAVENQVEPSTISNCTFTANVALGVQGGGSGAGATRNVLGSMDLTDCTFTNNVSRGGDGADGVNTFGQSNGGAIFNDRFATMIVTNCTIVNNVAQGGNQCDNSGAPSPDSAFVGSAFGAGIFNFRSATLTVIGTTFIGNEAVAGTSSAGPGALVSGGAIDSDLNSALTVNASRFIGNRAVGGTGAAGFQGGTAIGGAVINQFNSTASFADTLFAGNAALGGAGGAGAVGGDAVGGALVNGHPFGLQNVPDPSSLSVTDSTIVSNLALGGAGGAGANGGNGNGGGAFLAQGTACFDHSAFLANLALGGAAGAGGSSGLGIGGGLYIRPTAVAGAVHTAFFADLASTSDNDVFGILSPFC